MYTMKSLDAPHQGFFINYIVFYCGKKTMKEEMGMQKKDSDVKSESFKVELAKSANTALRLKLDRDTHTDA